MDQSALDMSASITSELLNSNSVVHIFGEFSPEMPWRVFVPCKYDTQLRCFKADIMIRTGQQFKFRVDNGKHYMVSDRYPCLIDAQGNLNNLYDPKCIKNVGQKK